MKTTDQPVPKESLIRYYAGDLSNADRQALAERIDGDPASRAILAEWQRQDAALAAIYAPLAEESVPSRYASLLNDARADPAPKRRTRSRTSVIGMAVVGIAVGASLGWAASRLFTPQMPDTATAAAAAFRTYSSDTIRPVEVMATDGPGLTLWIKSHLGREITAPDLSRAGLSLLGGRILPASTGAAAFFLYQSETGQRAALYVASGCQAGPTQPTPFTTPQIRGFWWRNRDLCIATVGPASEVDLQHIALMAYDALI